MSDLWRVFSSLSFDEMSALEEECDRLIDDYLAKHPKSRDTFGELSASKSVPKEKDARADYDKKGVPFPPELKGVLKACKSVLLIERPGMLDKDPLQVSVLAFVLEHAKDALVAFEEAPYQPSEMVLVELTTKKSAAGFGQKGSAPARAASKAKLDDVVIKPDRSVESVRHILDTFEAAQHNLDLQIDLRRILGQSSTLVKQYVTLLVNQGAVTDASAAKALTVPLEQVQKAREEVEKVVRTIRPPNETPVEAPAPVTGDGEPTE